MALTGCQSESNTAQKAETSVKSVVQSKTERNKANAIAFYLAILASAVLTVLFFMVMHGCYQALAFICFDGG